MVAPSCSEILVKVSAYVDGELAGVDRDLVAEHLAKCPECAVAAGEFQRLDTLLGRDPVPRVSGEEWTVVWEQILARRQDPIRKGAVVETFVRKLATRDRPVGEAGPRARAASWAGSVVAGIWTPRARWAWGAAAAAAVAIALVLGPFRGGVAPPERVAGPERPAGAPPAEAGPPKSSSQGKGDPVEAPPQGALDGETGHYAEHISGPKPEIEVDPEDGTTNLRYFEF